MSGPCRAFSRLVGLKMGRCRKVVPKGVVRGVAFQCLQPLASLLEGSPISRLNLPNWRDRYLSNTVVRAVDASISSRIF
jgi:hypothetical protein